MTLESIKNGPFVYPTVEENDQIRKKKYVELTKQEQLQDDCDVQATNIVLQALPPDVYALVKMTSNNVTFIASFILYLRNHMSKGIPWRRSKGFVISFMHKYDLVKYTTESNHIQIVSILLPSIGLNQVPWNELDLPDFTTIERVYLLDLKECMDDGDSRVAMEAKLFDALEHKSVVIEDAELDLTDSENYVTKEVLENMGFEHVSLSDYGRKMVNDVNVEIHGVKFKADLVVLDYVNEGEPTILFGRDFLAITKSQVNFGLGEIRMNLTKFKEGIGVINLLEERLEEIPPTLTIPPQSIYHPLTPKQKEKMKEQLDEILIGKERLNKKEFSEEDKVGIIEHVDTRASVMGEVKNVRIQIGYQAYVVDLLILDILVDPELPLLLGRPFLRTCGAIIDMERGTLCIDDKVIRHTYFPKPQSKSYVEAFEMEGEDDWLGSFEVGRDEDGNMKYGPVAPSFIDIEDDMERALAMEAYFNPFKNKIDSAGDWHGRFEIVMPSGRKFNQAFKTKTTTRKLSGKIKTKDVLRSPIMNLIEKSHKDTLPNPLMVEHEKRNKRNIITYSLQPVSNANLKWRDLPSVERHAYCEKLEMMKLEYIYEGDGYIFVDYSWERALSRDNEIYPEWVLEFFSTLYFDKDVDRNNLMKEKCIWFRLCRYEHILTLPEFAVVLGLFTKDEVKHRLFEIYFGRLEVDDKQFNHNDYWTRVGKPTLTNYKEVLMKEPLMRIVHKVIVGSLVHMVASRERCQKRDLWMMSTSEESHQEVFKPIDCEYWISKMLADELDVENTCLRKETEMPTQAKEGSSEPRQEHGGLNSSWRE
ncbi:retrovirus-related pol polyprotein from transposon TNT 1-94 [Tanacetum coccineum]